MAAPGAVHCAAHIDIASGPAKMLPHTKWVVFFIPSSGS